MATPSPLILLIDDEMPIRRFLRTSLAAHNFRLIEADTGQQAIRLAAQQPPDLVILDLGLPDVDGQDILKQLRQWLQAPIIVLSARDQESQKVTALDNGADDYLTKPFSTGELLARIRVALRHSLRVNGENESATFESGDLKVDRAARRVFARDQEIHLTPLEYKLLSTLIQHAGKVLTHRFLLNEVWGPNHQQETHYLRIYMASLRKKIEVDSAQPRHLLTEQGIGYRLAVDS
jgi:two-component system, OmpR family, KDP operon response regulator KdpE